MNPQDPTPPIETLSASAVNEGKTTAIVAYLTLIGLIIAFIMNSDKKNAFANFHIRQALGIGLTGLALGIVNIIPILGWIVGVFGSLLLIVLWVIGLMGAINGRQKEVPILGKKYQEWLKRIP